MDDEEEDGQNELLEKGWSLTGPKTTKKKKDVQQVNVPCTLSLFIDMMMMISFWIYYWRNVRDCFEYDIPPK